MNKKLRLTSFLLAFFMIFQSGVITAFATNKDQDNINFTVIEQEINEYSQSSKQVAQWNDSIFYTIVNPNITYCSQLTPDGRIQFSYILADGVIVESEIYDLNEVYNTCNLPRSRSAYNYDSINQVIIDNITAFTNVSRLENYSSPTIRAASTLSKAISDEFGANYTSKTLQSNIKKYNNKNYTVLCTEAQTTSNTAIETHWFGKETAITAVIAFAIGGQWTWVGAIKSIIESVVAYVVVNGIEKTVYAFTAERTNVSIMRTRKVEVKGYSGIQYWAGWTRKMYFFKGDSGWTHDTTPSSNVKHNDFDNVAKLVSTGWQNFINDVLER